MLIRPSVSHVVENPPSRASGARLDTPAALSSSSSPPSAFSLLFARVCRSRFAPYAIFTVFTALLLWPLCIGRSLYWGDITLYFEPMLRCAQNALHAGSIPLWNRYVNCGQPYVGNPQNAIFYPTTVLLPFVPVWLFLSLNTFLHVFFCGVCMLWFLRRWTLRRTSAVAGALVYMGSACLISRLQFPTMVQTAVYFPLLLTGVDACVDRPRLQNALRLAVFLALMIFAAHAQMAYLILIGASFYALMRLWATQKQIEQRLPDDAEEPGILALFALPSARFLMLGGGLGLLLASVQILPALQLLRLSPRDQMSLQQANRFILEPKHLLSLFLPSFTGHPAHADYWGGGNAWEPSLFVGWLPLLCVGYAVMRCNREGLVRFWAVIALLGLWLSLGSAGGLFLLAFNYVPGVANFHDPARFLLYTTFAFAVLTAVGLDAAQVRMRWFGPKTLLLSLLLIAAPLIWYGQAWNPTVAPTVWNYRARGVPALQTALQSSSPQSLRIYSLTHEHYWRRFVTDGYADYGPMTPAYVAGLMDTMMPNVPMRYGFEAVFGYEPVAVGGPASVDGLARAALRRGEPNLSRLMTLTNAGVLLTGRGFGISDPRLLPLEPVVGVHHQPAYAAWRNRDVLPRAWLVRQTHRIEGSLRTLSALAAPDFHPEKSAIVSAGRAESWLATEDSAATSSEPTRPVLPGLQTATSAEFRADAGNAPAFLVYSATAYPGWRVQVDGRTVPLYKTNAAFLGTPLTPGTHRILFTYAPDVYRVGVYLSLLAAGLLCGGVFALRMQRRSPTGIVRV